MKNWLKLVISIVGCELVGILGSIFTFSSIPDWYAYLNKPPFSPPNWLFGPVWTVLYLLMGISFYLIWQRGWKKKQNITARNYFLTQLGLNFIWTPIFFGLRAPLLALVVIIAMWVATVVTIQKLYPISKWAAYLLVPYLLWISFATILNMFIVVLN